MNRVSLVIAFGAFVLNLWACGSAPESTPAPESPAASTTPAATGRVTAGWTATDGVETPESVYVDAASGSIFVSMIAGQATGAS